MDLTAALRWLGVLVGALSLVALCQAGFELAPFTPPLQTALDADDEVKRFVFRLLEPILHFAAGLLSNWTGWDLQLYPYWKHIVVLLWLYFGAGARMAWKQDDRSGAIFRIALGGVIAVVAGAAFGLIPMEPRAATALAGGLEHQGIPVGGRIGVNLLAVLFPVAAVVVFALGVAAWVAVWLDRSKRSPWTAFREYASTFPLLYGYVGCGAVAVLLLLNNVPQAHSLFELLPNPGLLLLLLLISCLAFFLRWSERRLEPDNNLGLSMLQSLFGAVGFVFADATWKLIAG